MHYTSLPTISKLKEENKTQQADPYYKELQPTGKMISTHQLYNLTLESVIYICYDK